MYGLFRVLQFGLKTCFDRSPDCFTVVFWDDDAYLVADTSLKVRDTREKNAVFAATRFDVVGAIVLHECANDLAACNWTNLLVDKPTVICDSELEDVAFDQL